MNTKDVLMSRFLRGWIPPRYGEESDGKKYQSARLSVFLALLTIAASFGFAFEQYFWLEYTFGAIVCSVAAVQVLIALILFRLQYVALSPSDVGNQLAFAFFWGLSVASFVTGGMESPILVWIITSPLMALILVGRRSAWRWFGAVVLEISLWTALAISGYSFPQWISPEQRLLFLVSILPVAMVIVFIFMYYFEATTHIAYQKSERLLRNVLPTPIARRIQRGERLIADTIPSVSVLFADIVGFTALTSTLERERLVALLNMVFTSFDNIAGCYHLEKIKTIGDSYMLAGGVPAPDDQHACRMARAALSLRDEIRHIGARLALPLDIRIGIHAGEVVAGVIGKYKFTFDIWGETVDRANQLETEAEPGSILISEEYCALLQGQFLVEARRTVPSNVESNNEGKLTAVRYYLLHELPTASSFPMFHSGLTHSVMAARNPYQYGSISMEALEGGKILCTH